MNGSSTPGAASVWVKRCVRRAARWAAGVRKTRAWPVLRPVYRVARRVVDVDRVVGLARSRALWLAHDKVYRIRRRLLTLGFTDAALDELRDLAADDTEPFRQRLAAWELALWHADQGGERDPRMALDHLHTAARDEVDPARLRRIAVIEAECHELAGDRAAARAALARGIALGRDPDLLLARANLAASAADRVAAMNEALAAYRLPALMVGAGPSGEPGGPGGPDAPAAPAALDRLTALPQGSRRPAVPWPSVPRRSVPRRVLPRRAAARRGAARADAPCVSVLIPAYNAEGTIRTALDSVLSQTWSNLEVLVVDDGSADATAAVVERYAGADARVRLIRARSNGGPYVARNLALSAATGELVTCHDADDWSHPERIERQARHLLTHPSVIGNTSQQVRATADLRFHRRGQPGLYVFRNLSSFMFRRRPVMEAVGYWDSVRFGADEELVQRITTGFGADAVVDLETGPLCVQRQSSGSLTTDPQFGYPGFLMGARLDYYESYRHHHRTASSLRYPFPRHGRPFPVAAPLLPAAEPADPHFDVVIASDFRLVGGSTMSNIEEVKAQRQLGLRTGLVQMARYAVDPMRSVLPQVRDQVDGDRVRMLVAGETVSCDLLIVRYPPVLQDWQRYVPRVRPGRVRVIVNQPPMSDYGRDAVPRYDLARCERHLRRYFGEAGVWHPIGPLVRTALHEHHADALHDIALAADDWVNIIDVDAWRRESRPGHGGPPRIGRHSRDHAVKWPATAREILAAYPDSPDYQVHILGGAQAPEQVLGYRPGTWHVRPFGDITPKEFLAGLDLFVYYTHPDWVESFGRVILEAMAAGVPAILPHSYRELFGDAAVYAKPSEVMAAVDRLMADPDLYDSRVLTAQRYVEENFGYTLHAARVRALLRPTPDRRPETA